MRRAEVLYLAALLTVACSADRDTGGEGAGIGTTHGVEVQSQAATRAVDPVGNSPDSGAETSGLDGTPTRPVSGQADAGRDGKASIDGTVSRAMPAPVARRPPVSPQSHASGESRFLRDGRLMADAFNIVQDGQAWTATVRDFENDGLADPGARDLHQLFGDWLRASLGRHGLELAGFGCGQSLCAATIPLIAPDARERYVNWGATAAKQPPMPLPLFVESAFSWPDGASEMRILFSTDPHVAANHGP